MWEAFSRLAASSLLAYCSGYSCTAASPAVVLLLTAFGHGQTNVPHASLLHTNKQTMQTQRHHLSSNSYTTPYPSSRTLHQHTLLLHCEGYSTSLTQNFKLCEVHTSTHSSAYPHLIYSPWNCTNPSLNRHQQRQTVTSVLRHPNNVTPVCMSLQEMVPAWPHPRL